MNKTKKGFTLIEMLVVVSLIGILSALALVSFTSSQKQARDVQRKSDLKQYQTLLENYANSNDGLYPIRASAVSADVTLCSDLDLTNCIADPKNVSPYLYRYISDSGGVEYLLFGALENVSTTNYWIVCSSGKNGTSTSVPSSSSCPI